MNECENILGSVYIKLRARSGAGGIVGSVRVAHPSGQLLCPHGNCARKRESTYAVLIQRFRCDVRSVPQVDLYRPALITEQPYAHTL